MSVPTTTDPICPLLLSDDPGLREELARLSAGAGARLELPPGIGRGVAEDPLWLARSWAEAPAVLVGADCAARVAATAPPRRPGVQVVGWGPGDEDVLRAALALGAEEVVELPRGEVRLVELLTDLADAPGATRRAPAPVLGVVGGAGGAGATVLACALGRVASERGTCLLVDGDPLGPGLDRVLGHEDAGGVRWDDLATGGGRLGARSLREALPAQAGLGVLTWASSVGSEAVPPGADTVREALSAGRRGHDLVVIDLPRAALTAPAAAELLRRCDRVLVVCGTTVPALLSAARVRRDLAPGTGPGPLRVVVRGRDLGPDDVARVVGAPAVGAVPHQRGLAEAVDLGLGPFRSSRSPLARAARRVLDAALVDLASPAAGWAGWAA